MNKCQRDKKALNDLVRDFGLAHIRDYNPLGIPFKTFNNYTTAYLWVLGMMQKGSPKGWVDLVLLTCIIIEKPFVSILDLFGTNRRLTETYIFNWACITRDDENVLRLYFQTLHSRVGTTFSESHFLEAMELFRNANMDENNKKI